MEWAKSVSVKRKEKKNYAGVITPQAWIKATETELSDSEVLTLPGGFELATPKSLAWPRALGFQGSYSSKRETADSLMVGMPGLWIGGRSMALHGTKKHGAHVSDYFRRSHLTPWFINI